VETIRLEPIPLLLGQSLQEARIVDMMIDPVDPGPPRRGCHGRAGSEVQEDPGLRTPVLELHLRVGEAGYEAGAELDALIIEEPTHQTRRADAIGVRMAHDLDVPMCEHLLEKAEVALIPGSSFGDAGRGFLRMSFAASEEDLIEAARRIGEVLS